MPAHGYASPPHSSHLHYAVEDAPCDAVASAQAVLIATRSGDTEGLLRQLLLFSGLPVTACLHDLSMPLALPTSARRSVLLLDHAFAQNKRGLKMLGQLSRPADAPRVIVIGGNPDADDKRRYLEAGAHGHVALSTNVQTLGRAIHEVAADGLWFERKVIVAVLRRRLFREQEVAGPEGTNVSETLTPREQAVALRASKGLRNREIAGELHISEKTVKIHLSRVYRKLGVSNRVQLGLSYRR